MPTFRCWMTKMFAGDFGRVIIKARPEWSPLFAPCRWDWTTAGTRFSSTCQTSPGGPMEPTTSRRCVYRSAEAARAGSPSPTLRSFQRMSTARLPATNFLPVSPSDPRKLSNKTGVLLRQAVFWGRASSRVQALPACPEPESQGWRRSESTCLNVLHSWPYSPFFCWCLAAVEPEPALQSWWKPINQALFSPLRISDINIYKTVVNSLDLEMVYV